jgi:hypothetical protein
MYNDLCKQLQSLAKQRQVPHTAFLPRPIDTENLFALDVDDNVWDDAGLDDSEDGAVPPWLGSKDVHAGIKYLLLRDRCIEEEGRLKRERAAMQMWMQEEWEILQLAYAENGI